MNPIFKTDDMGAFGGGITINLKNPNNFEISKVIFVCGCIQKVYENPTFPLHIAPTSEETAKFNVTNVCYLIAFDSEGRQKTCRGTLTIPAQNGVLKDGRTCC
ncbi:MAG: hypothetical protein II234_00620 [Clostridia bacterium]|nr:hypothetical protein [Clostridia bacterium]MBQ5900872.1 hypothetical protein [Clostridia bacterium]